MKWAILIPRFLPEKIGGNFIYVDWFAKNLVIRGHEVHIFTTTLDSNLENCEKKNGYLVHRVLVKRGNAGSLRFSSTRALTNCFLEIDKKIIFDILNPHAPFQIIYEKVRDQIKIIHTLHAVVTYEYLFGLKKLCSQRINPIQLLKELLMLPEKLPACFFREKKALVKAEKIIVMSNYVKQTIKNFFPRINTEKIFVSRIGIDSDRFNPAENKAKVRRDVDLPVNSPVFFTVRRLVLRMGLENLIKACAICLESEPDSKFKLYIAGKGSMYKDLRNLIEQYNLSNVVNLLGFIDDDKLLKYYQASDVFILPTEELEGFGIVTIEALACNLPVIATPAGANREVAGLFCPELITKDITAGAIAEKMMLYLNKKSHYIDKQYNLAVKEKFDWNKIISEIEKEIQSNE